MPLFILNRVDENPAHREKDKKQNQEDTEAYGSGNKHVSLDGPPGSQSLGENKQKATTNKKGCLLYTSDAADE